MRAQTCDVSSVHYNSIKHVRDISSLLYGAIMNLNWPITACASSQADFINYKYIYVGFDFTF